MISDDYDLGASDYEFVDERPSDGESAFDTNSVLSTWDYEDDTPDNSSAISEDNLGESESDNESLGGDNSHNSFSSTPSIHSFDSEQMNNNDFSESILNNTLSFPASLSGSNSTLKFPTASTNSLGEKCLDCGSFANTECSYCMRKLKSILVNGNKNDISKPDFNSFTPSREELIWCMTKGYGDPVVDDYLKTWAANKKPISSARQSLLSSFFSACFTILRYTLYVFGFIAFLFLSGTFESISSFQENLFPSPTIIPFQVNASYHSDGSPMIVGFNLSIPGDVAENILTLSRIFPENGIKTSNTILEKALLEPTSAKREKYFDIPESERWGVLKGCLVTTPVSPEEVFEPIQKNMVFYYGSEADNQADVNGTLIWTFRHRNENLDRSLETVMKVKDMYKSCVDIAQRRVLEMYDGILDSRSTLPEDQRTFLKPQSEVSIPKQVDISAPSSENGQDLYTNVVMFGYSSAKNFISIVSHQLETISASFLRNVHFLLKDVGQLDSVKSTVDLALYLKEVSETSLKSVTNLPQYEVAVELGNKYLLSTKQFLLIAQKAAVKKVGIVRKAEFPVSISMLRKSHSSHTIRNIGKIQSTSSLRGSIPSINYPTMPSWSH